MSLISDKNKANIFTLEHRLSTVTSGAVRLSRVREAEAQAFTLDWRMASWII
ncbi:hypothetical protein [Desulfotruncus alcoholivorax]|uniref:hypothetical protein n=1 Tax=Desulfotruncus alcoholivorax TaxID=265477 RepID=UPI0004034F49|nr:hypothetical protein [Desulfotruncus alcoholivorax]